MARRKKQDTNTAPVRYEVVTEEDKETGDIILPLPPELLERMGWREGDSLEWKQTSAGSWILTKEVK